jgi:hypothetical protein
MNHSRIWKAPIVALLFVLAAGACSSSGGSKADGDKSAFCKTNAEINAELTKVTSADEALAAIKGQEGKFDAYVKNAPSEVKAEAQLQVETARKAIDKDDATLLSDAKIQTAGEKVDSFCGVKSSSSSSSDSASSSDTSDTTDSESSSSDAKGNAAVCGSFESLQEFTQLSSELTTKSWPEIQAAFAAQKDAVAEAYSKIEASAPDSVAADVKKVAAFTEKLLAAAATASSPEEWGQLVSQDPGAVEAGEAAQRMSTFAQEECGIDPSAVNS